jgi:hypothetical protein
VKPAGAVCSFRLLACLPTLLDLRLPGLDGAETLAALRAVDPGVRCCLRGDLVYDAEVARLLALGRQLVG